MPSECKTIRAELLGADSEAPQACAHLEVCTECARWAAGLERRESALTQLMRLNAPPELDGGVVQALQAGFRQDRAVRALGELERADSPRELQAALDLDLSGDANDGWQPDSEGGESPVQSLPAARRLNAPAVLADLVAEEIGDPGGHRARRFVGSLARLSAPEEIAERLVRDGWQAPRRRSRLPAALAGAGLVCAALLVTFLPNTPAESPARTYGFVVETVDSPAELVGLGVGLADAASGGILSARSL